MTLNRILLIEDEPLIAGLLEEILVGAGHRVCAVAATEAAAVAAAKWHRPDLIIADAGLRIGDGVSAIETILTDGPVPHFFISGDSALVSRRRPDAIILAKPFREIDLMRAIRRVGVA
jgi:CheY-like chemotaxis protein